MKDDRVDHWLHTLATAIDSDPAAAATWRFLRVALAGMLVAALGVGSVALQGALNGQAIDLSAVEAQMAKAALLAFGTALAAAVDKAMRDLKAQATAETPDQPPPANVVTLVPPAQQPPAQAA